MNETMKTEQQVTTQAEPTAWERWNTAVQHFVEFEEKVAQLQIAHELVKAYRKVSGDTHTED